MILLKKTCEQNDSGSIYLQGRSAVGARYFYRVTIFYEKLRGGGVGEDQLEPLSAFIYIYLFIYVS